MLLQELELPEATGFSAQWVANATARLDAASRVGPAALKQVLPADTCVQLLDRCQRLLHVEPTLLEVGGPGEEAGAAEVQRPCCRRWQRRRRGPLVPSPLGSY